MVSRSVHLGARWVNRSSELMDAIAVTDSPVGSGGAGGGPVHGRQVNASNTGLNYNGVTVGSLTVTGATTYATPGQVVTGRDFTGAVTINADNVTLRNCRIRAAGGYFTKALVINGNGALIEGCLIAPPSSGYYMAAHVSGGANATFRGCDMSGGENILTIENDGVTVDQSFLWGTTNASDAAGHCDTIEVYGGNGHSFTKSKLIQTAGYWDGVINIAPWWGSTVVDGVDVLDCYLDGGRGHLLVDLQSTGYIRNIRVLRADMGGHTDDGSYRALQNNDGRSIVQTTAAQAADPDALLWPTSGADASHWVDCSDLSPDRTGQIVIP